MYVHISYNLPKNFLTRLSSPVLTIGRVLKGTHLSSSTPSHMEGSKGVVLAVDSHKLMMTTYSLPYRCLGLICQMIPGPSCGTIPVLSFLVSAVICSIILPPLDWANEQIATSKSYITK